MSTLPISIPQRQRELTDEEAMARLRATVEDFHRSRSPFQNAPPKVNSSTFTQDSSLWTASARINQSSAFAPSTSPTGIIDLDSAPPPIFKADDLDDDDNDDHYPEIPYTPPPPVLRTQPSQKSSSSKTLSARDVGYNIGYLEANVTSLTGQHPYFAGSAVYLGQKGLIMARADSISVFCNAKTATAVSDATLKAPNQGNYELKSYYRYTVNSLLFCINRQKLKIKDIHVFPSYDRKNPKADCDIAILSLMEEPLNPDLYKLLNPCPLPDITTLEKYLTTCGYTTISMGGVYSDFTEGSVYYPFGKVNLTLNSLYNYRVGDVPITLNSVPAETNLPLFRGLVSAPVFTHLGLFIGFLHSNTAFSPEQDWGVQSDRTASLRRSNQSSAGLSPGFSTGLSNQRPAQKTSQKSSWGLSSLTGGLISDTYLNGTIVGKYIPLSTSDPKAAFSFLKEDPIWDAKKVPGVDTNEYAFNPFTKIEDRNAIQTVIPFTDAQLKWIQTILRFYD